MFIIYCFSICYSYTHFHIQTKFLYKPLVVFLYIPHTSESLRCPSMNLYQNKTIKHYYFRDISITIYYIGSLLVLIYIIVLRYSLIMPTQYISVLYYLQLFPILQLHYLLQISETPSKRNSYTIFFSPFIDAKQVKYLETQLGYPEMHPILYQILILSSMINTYLAGFKHSTSSQYRIGQVSIISSIQNLVFNPLFLQSLDIFSNSKHFLSVFLGALLYYIEPRNTIDMPG